MARDDLYESKNRKDKLTTHSRLAEIIDKVKGAEDLMEEVGIDDLREWANHTIELSYRLRERAIELCPEGHLGVPEFDEAYTKQFRDLDAIELESMILSHERHVHRRRPQTIRIIRDAYMNKLLMEGNDGLSSQEDKEGEDR